MSYVRLFMWAIIVTVAVGLVCVGIYHVFMSSEKLTKDQIIVIYPTFTEAAYNPGGFYDFYNGACDKRCLTIGFSEHGSTQMSSSRNSYNMFHDLGFRLVSDQELDANPDIIDNYSKVIVLHNEYVTQREFDAITNHPNALYLYPNSLYAKVELNKNDTITLIRGHHYPPANVYPYEEVRNGFNWKDDTTRFEMDRKCDDIQFIPMSNGKALNCYPEYSLQRIEIADEIMKK